jgi:hypothetical protein
MQVTPLWLIFHMVGPPVPEVDKALACVYAAVWTVFATGKFSQAIAADIGDKSIFECVLLPFPPVCMAIDIQSPLSKLVLDNSIFSMIRTFLEGKSHPRPN